MVSAAASAGAERSPLAASALGRRSKRIERGRRQDGPPKSVRGTLSAAKDAGRANLLSWEITDFPTHREPQAVCRNIGQQSLPARCRCIQKKGADGNAWGPTLRKASPHLSASWEIGDFPTWRNRAARVLWRRETLPLSDAGGAMEVQPLSIRFARRP